jgi:hypothetical protein
MSPDGANHCVLNFVEVERLREIREGAELAGNFRGVFKRDSGDHDYRSSRVCTTDVIEKIVSAQSRHIDVCDYHVVILHLQICECLLGTIRGMAFVRCGQKVVKRVSDECVVIDDEEGCHARHVALNACFDARELFELWGESLN